MSMRHLSLLCATVFSVALIGSAWSQRQIAQVALVVGNANYPDASAPISTTVKDARTLAEELRRYDFDVDLKENVGKEEMQRAIDAFTGKIRSGTVALFYFSGFGIQVARQTYLIPVNGQVWTEADARRDGISLDAVLAEIHRKGARVKIVIVDAARRNPFERRFRASAAGLAALDAPDGTLAMYAAAPGKVTNDGSGENSLFIKELIKEIRIPNISAEEVFNHARIGVSRASNNEQVPWVASSLIEEFSFGRSRQAATAPAVPPATPTPTPAIPPRPAPAATPAPTKSTPQTAGLSETPATPSTANKPGDAFRDCPDCGEVVVVPSGVFEMGSASDFERPMHRVTIAKPFAIGRYEVTFEEWDRCVAAGRCKYKPNDRSWGRENRPVINVSWVDTKEFLSWLTEKTGKTYRLPTEAEWEYAARGGTNTTYWWGREIGARQANCRECATGGALQTLPVGSFRPNAFGLYDMAGNAAEWAEDCWNDSYRGAPQNGSAWTAGQCSLRVLRGGAYDSQAKYVGSAARFRYDSDVRYVANGFRVLRELP
jgi:formylglycine-generating enzyme required for sulfatase activity